LLSGVCALLTAFLTGFRMTLVTSALGDKFTEGARATPLVGKSEPPPPPPPPPPAAAEGKTVNGEA
jgi:hypothetical protein